MKTKLIRKAGCIVMMASGLMLSTGSLAMAQGATTKSAEPREIDFGEADEVEGVLVNPNGENFEVRPPSKTRSLIKVRQDFIPELLQSTSEV